MITNNIINPKIYECTKVVDMSPQGILKITLKQDELDLNRDNVELLICDYFDDSGEIRVDEPEEQSSDKRTSVIKRMWVDQNGELIENDGSYPVLLYLGKASYYTVEFSKNGVQPDWRLEMIDENDEFTEDEKDYYNKLLVITKYDDTTIAVKPGKAYSLLGKKFLLTVQDHQGYYKSSLELEVASHV